MAILRRLKLNLQTFCRSICQRELQTPFGKLRLFSALLGLALLLYVAAFFMVTNDADGREYLGYEAAAMAFSDLSRLSAAHVTSEDLLAAFVFNAGNIAVAILMLTLLLKPKRWHAAIILIGAIQLGLWFIIVGAGEHGGTREGFYVWIFAQFIIFIVFGFRIVSAVANDDANSWADQSQLQSP